MDIFSSISPSQSHFVHKNVETKLKTNNFVIKRIQFLLTSILRFELMREVIHHNEELNEAYCSKRERKKHYLCSEANFSTSVRPATVKFSNQKKRQKRFTILENEL